MLIKGLYTIKEIKKTEKGIEAFIHLDKNHEVFKGHFPGNPVMPGVCMIQIIKELTEEAVGKKLFLKTSSNIKFMTIINPEINPDLKLTIEIREADGELRIRNTSSFNDTVDLRLNAVFVEKTDKKSVEV